MGDRESTGPPDRQTLRLLERHLSRDARIETTRFDPDTYEPRLLRAHFDAARWPTGVEVVRLDVRWFETRDFSFHYLESGANEWECRWDRHPNDHNTRVHFHPPPGVGDAVDLALSSLHPLDVLSTVRTAITQRLDDHWTTD
ncbi:hypothetical protein GCM10009037_19980 [Halarchaeum grantii]|uniref:Uncharacterized protein n=1 Tax=Halarchaeum grantii TaxID=1193105 RepID=A0A830EY71_9EURY|nr:hypothetical protein [Halarchaeum grantii]GGL36390.1 hypothetical protein GCM10009037_19980 [Halarchaeum grantii]